MIIDYNVLKMVNGTLSKVSITIDHLIQNQNASHNFFEVL